MLNILLTFDYELFLGENFYSPEEVLFNPTATIVSLLRQYNACGTFFADVCSVSRHKDFGLNDYCARFGKQLNCILHNGNDVQLHVHPNWLTSEFNHGKWEFDKDHYSLHSFASSKEGLERIKQILTEGVNYLYETLLPENPGYRCIAYRGGGYCIQPILEILPSLISLGIKIDSSVAAFSKVDDIYRYRDYSEMPQSLNWYMNYRKKWNDESNSGLFEIPIWASKNNLIKKLINPDAVSFKRDPKRGEFITYNKKPSGIINTALSYMNGRTLFSLDSMCAQYIWSKLVQLSQEKGNGYVAIICHPKLFGINALNNLETFLKLFKQHEKEFTLLTTTDVSKKMEDGTV